MSSSPDTPSFEEWAAYAMKIGPEDWAGTSIDDEDLQRTREIRIARMPRAVTCRYLTRLLENPGEIAQGYTDDEVAAAVWYIFGVSSSWFAKIRSPDVPVDEQARCFRAVGTMYTGFFDKRCCAAGADSKAQFINVSRLDSAVYMIWDMDQIEGPLHFPNQAPHLVEPSFHSLECALFRCATSTCHMSALHALGHVHDRHPDRCEAMIDRFLSGGDRPDWLREYAAAAREGGVM